MKKRFDPVRLAKYYKANQTAFFLDIKKWRSFKTLHKIDWEVVPFRTESRDKIPKEPGLYAFIISSDHPKLPPHSYVLYVGQSGDGTSQHNLRMRFGDYLRDQKNGASRHAVDRMLIEFKDDLKKASPLLRSEKDYHFEDGIEWGKLEYTKEFENLLKNGLSRNFKAAGTTMWDIVHKFIFFDKGVIEVSQ